MADSLKRIGMVTCQAKALVLVYPRHFERLSRWLCRECTVDTASTFEQPCYAEFLIETWRQVGSVAARPCELCKQLV